MDAVSAYQLSLEEAERMETEFDAVARDCRKYFGPTWLKTRSLSIAGEPDTKDMPFYGDMPGVRYE